MKKKKRAQNRFLTAYRSAGCFLIVQQHANVLTNNITEPVPTKMYGANSEYSPFISKYLCISTCIHIPEQTKANPDACYRHRHRPRCFVILLCFIYMQTRNNVIEFDEAEHIRKKKKTKNR